MQEDEFDRYFARAALEHEKLETDTAEAARRGSLPNTSLLVADPAGVRRAASCRHARRPRNISKSPSRRSSAVSINRDDGSGGMSLRAPLADTRPHSAPHSRSSSWKKSKRPRSGRPGDMNEDSRSRSGSISIEDTLAKLEQLKLLQSEDVYPVRSFATSSRGLVNRGDSFKRKTNKQVTSSDAVVTVPVHSRGSPESEHDVVVCVDDVPPSPTNQKPAKTHKAYVIGAHGVGKTALLQQFMTSDYMGGTETYGDEDSEVTVTVQLDGEATSIDFTEVTPEQTIPVTSDIDAWVLVFGLNDQESFQIIQTWLDTFKKNQSIPVATIIVANKSDLVRNRQVKDEDAREICRRHDCKFATVSAVMNHKVDDLLVGVAKQIQLNPERHLKKQPSNKDPPKKNIAKGPKGLFGKLFNKKQPSVSRSCDNLLVL